MTIIILYSSLWETDQSLFGGIKNEDIRNCDIRGYQSCNAGLLQVELQEQQLFDQHIFVCELLVATPAVYVVKMDSTVSTHRRQQNRNSIRETSDIKRLTKNLLF